MVPLRVKVTTRDFLSYIHSHDAAVLIDQQYVGPSESDKERLVSVWK